MIEESNATLNHEKRNTGHGLRWGFQEEDKREREKDKEVTWNSERVDDGKGDFRFGWFLNLFEWKEEMIFAVWARFSWRK